MTAGAGGRAFHRRAIRSHKGAGSRLRRIDGRGHRRKSKQQAADSARCTRNRRPTGSDTNQHQGRMTIPVCWSIAGRRTPRTPRQQTRHERGDEEDQVEVGCRLRDQTRENVATINVGREDRRYAIPQSGGEVFAATLRRSP